MSPEWALGPVTEAEKAQERVRELQTQVERQRQRAEVAESRLAERDKELELLRAAAGDFVRKADLGRWAGRWAA